MVNNKELNEQLFKTMFQAIRSTEVKNTKTKKHDDKTMVSLIEKHIYNKVREEMKNNED